MQIKYLNRALQRFDATQVIPVQFVLFTLSVIGGSAILYRDFERTSAQDAGEFVGGCALTFFGVWLITSGRPARRDDEEEDREPEPDDAINLIEERYRDGVDGMNKGSGGSAWRSSTSRTSSPPIKIHSRYRDDPDSRPSTPANKVKASPSTRRLEGNEPSSNDAHPLVFPNPWPQQNETELRAPTFSRHTSTPVLPSEAAPPPLASVSDPELASHLPHTPIRGKSHDETYNTPPTAHSQLRRLRTGDRMAKTSIPGPLLASPLSTTLSAMV